MSPRPPRACCSRRLRRGIGLLLAFALLNTFVSIAPASLPGIAQASSDLRVFAAATVLIALTGVAIGLWPAVPVLRAGGWQGLRSWGTSSPRVRPRVRFALVTTQIALTMALLGGHPRDAEAFLRRIAADLDPLLPVAVERLDAQVARLTERPRFTAWLLSAFAGLALLPAAAGLYSVAAYLSRSAAATSASASQSAPRRATWRARSSGKPGVGASAALVGSALGWMATRALQSQLYQVEALDPWSWTGALLTRSVVPVMAAFGPAYRAAHVDPVTALRVD